MEDGLTPVPELTARGRASRARIVQAATKLMLERGVSATSVEDVLEAAGASKGQLYHYFDGKHDLIQAVIEAANASVLAAQEPHLATLDSWDAIEAWCDHIVGLKERNGCSLGCPLGTLTSELAATDEAARALLAQAYDRAGRAAEARTAYADFLAFWKTADRDLPIVIEASKAFARLSS